MKFKLFFQKTLSILLVILAISACTKDAITEKSENGALTPKPIEELTSDYFASNKGEVDNSAKIISVTNEFFAINKTKEFETKKPFKIQPVYAYGIDGVAYYELWLTEDGISPKGWLLISATDKDYPLVNFSMGIPYSYNLLNKGNLKSTSVDKNNKVYRFGVSYFTLEDKNGNKLNEYGKMPSVIFTGTDLGDGEKGDSKNPGDALKSSKVTAQEGIDYVTIGNYEALKSAYAKYYFNANRSAKASEMRQRIFPLKGHGEAFNTLKGSYSYRWVSGTRPYYTQIPAHTSVNTTGCWSGCNNNAWANVFGWWDRNMSKANLIPTTSTGETSPMYRNTAARRQVTDPVQMYCRAVCGTYCNDGGGWTYWSNAWKGYQYASSKGYGWSYWYRWQNIAGSHVDLANIVTDCIANNYRPVHIGANSHFYFGYGWAQWSDNTDWTWAYCYPGWSENDNDNVWIWWHDFNSSTKVLVY